MKPYRKGHKSIKHIIHLNVKGMRIMFAERGFFLKKFLAHPTQIGSVTPSTKHLAETMLKRLDWANMKQVVELGAGTGVFTEYIEAHRRPDCRALIIEQDKLLREDLSRRFPRMEFGAQAETLPFLMQKFGMEKADCIISGLPFAVLGKDLSEKILRGVRASLKENGEFVAFQYSPQIYRRLRQIFREVRIGFEIRNFPPAFVYRCRL